MSRFPALSRFPASAKDHEVRLTCGEVEIKQKTTYESKNDNNASGQPCSESFEIDVSSQDLQDALELSRDLMVNIGGRKLCVLKAPSRAKMLKFVKAARSGAY